MSENESRDESSPFSFHPSIADTQGSLHGLSGSEKIEWLEQNLPAFNQGTPEEPGEGFSEFEHIHDLSERADLPPSNESTVKFKFRSENFVEREAYVDGEIRDVFLRNLEVVDIYWEGRFILFQGTQKGSNAARRTLEKSLLSQLHISDITLNPGNLRDPNLLPSGLELGSTKSISAKGGENHSQITLHGAIDDADDRLTKHGKVSHLTGNFRYYSYRVIANVSDDQIYIYKVTHPQKSLVPNEELTVAMSFVQEILRVNYLLHDSDSPK